METTKPSSHPILYVPLVAGVLSMLFSAIYMSQRMGMLAPNSVDRFVHQHLDSFVGLAMGSWIVSFVLLCVLAKKYRASTTLKLGVVSLAAALVLYLCLPF